MSTIDHKPSFVLRIALIFVLVAVFSFQAVMPANAAVTVLYVTVNGLTTGACASWATACELQYALRVAGSGFALWVKMGTYHPTGSTDRTVSFSLKNGVALYGGFAGTETDLSQRDPITNLTILSGDIGVPGDNTDNSYHVVVGMDTDQTAILDGFIVQAGNANGAYPANVGGGTFNSGGGATFTNVTFLGNSATNGGAMFNRGSSPIFTNVTFQDNRAAFAGGGIYNHASSTVLTRVSFLGNRAMEGGGIYNSEHSNPTLTNVTFRNNSATQHGGGLYNFYSSAVLTGVNFSDNLAEYGGGMYNDRGDPPTLTSVTFRGNRARSSGGGMGNEYSSPALTNVLFVDNSAGSGGGMYNYKSSPNLRIVTFRDNSAVQHGGGMANGWDGAATLTDVIFTGNSAESGGGIYSETYFGLGPTLMRVTFSSNTATHRGGGMVGTATLTNVTFSNNSAVDYGGGMVSESGGSDEGFDSILTNVTFSGNTAPSGGGLYNWEYSYTNILNSILYGDSGGEIVSAPSGRVFVSYSDVQGGYPGDGNISADPLLSPLADNGGFTQTMALGAGSPAIDTAEDAFCPPQDQRGLSRPQGAHCDMGAYEAGGNIHVTIGVLNVGSYVLVPMESMRQSYLNVNGGPVRIVNTDAPLIAAERVIYKVSGVNTSFTEMMGLPDSQLDMIYWLPWYNNKDLDTQLRFANVTGSPATVTITIGGQPMGDPIPLAAGASTRVSFPGVNAGPVKIVSTQNIVAAERLIYKVAGKKASFSEMMALPNKALDTTYWLPWYNNKDLDTQLRFANVSASPAQVHVYIGGLEMTGSPFPLAAGESMRKSFPGVTAGPVQIVSNVPIVAAERLICKVNNVATSFTEMMALPNSAVHTTYWLPWYNNKDLDTQLRFANVHASQTATVHVYIGGVEMQGSPFTLLPGESTRQSFVNINDGPVQIVSNVQIVAAERLIYKVNNIATSFSEMMALPASQLDTTYWLPWYNNLDLDTQLRFGVP